MTCYMIKLRYDGTNYAGYQKQANANTVGEEVLNALTTLFGSVGKLSGCSRTDSGVHANCYCASFHSEKNIEPQKVIRGLNGILPRDIAVFDCAEVSPDFHARYSVKAKEYIYLILNSSVSAFCAAGASVEDKVRTVESVGFERNGYLVTFRVRGDGFLYNMVRIMVGTCLDIATGKIGKGKIKEIIDSKNRENAGHTAPARGLFLNDVIY